MVSKAQKIRLGIFITIGSFLILLFIVVVAGSRLMQKRDIYYVQFADVSVSGLQVGGSVNYHGIKVGRVDNIKIDPDDVSKVIITISVERGTPIKEDVEATLVPVGITGLKSVEIRGGTQQAKLVKPKSFLKTGVSTFEDITGKAVSIAEKVEIIAANLTQITGSENQKNVSEILRQTSMLLSDTRENLSSTLENLTVIAANAANIAESASKNLNDLTQATVSNMDKLTNTTTVQIEQLGSNLNQSISQLTKQTNALISDTQYRINAVGENTDKLVLQTSLEINKIALSINHSLDKINRIVSSAQFDTLLTNVSVISTQLAASDLKQLITDLNLTVKQTSGLLSNIDRTVTRGRTDLLETLESLRESAENLNDFTKQISENPASLFIGK